MMRYRSSRACLVSLTSLMVCVIPTPASAAHYYRVTSAADNVNAVVTAGHAGTQADPYLAPSLRSAIIAANGDAGSTIIFDPAVINAGNPITLTRMGNDANSNSGDLDINANMTISGNGAASTIIQAASNAGFAGSIGDKVIGINQDGLRLGLTVTVSNVTIRYGRNTVADGDPTFAYTGGGVDVFLTGTGNSILFSDCVINGNENVNSYGGGVNVDSGPSGLPGDNVGVFRGTVTFLRCTVSSNKSKQNGGGINLFADNHNVVIDNCTIQNNVTTGLGGFQAMGGGINVRHTNNGSVTIQNNTVVSGNTGCALGGGVCMASPGKQAVTIQNSSIIGNTVTNNTSFSSQGGGLYIDNQLATTLNNVTISNNHADTIGVGGTPVNPQGGGVCAVRGTVIIGSGTVISGNTAVDGAGIYSQANTATTTMTGGVIENNQAKNGGAGVFVLAGSVTVTGARIQGNAADSDHNLVGDGGAMYNGGGTLTARFNRIIGNSAATTASSGLRHAAGTTSVINNWWGCNAGPGTAGCQAVSGTTAYDPWLQLNITSSPASVARAGGTCTLTGTLTKNSAGATPAGGAVPDTTPITFTGILGSTSPGATTTVSGTANSTYTAGNNCGSGSGSATVDNQTVSVPITVTSPPITATATGGGTICAGSSSSVSVTFSGGTSPYTATLNNGGGTLTGPSPLLFAVSPAVTTAYSVSAANDSWGCPATAAGGALVTVTAPPTVATAGLNQAICIGGTTTGLGGNTPTVGTGSWSVMGGGTGTFAPNITIANATFTHIGGAGPIVLRWTIANPPCSASIAEVTVAVNPFVIPDFNHDCAVDLTDFGTFAACATGANVPYNPVNLSPGCTLVPDGGGKIAADFDQDGDVDTDDLAVYQRCFSGTGIVPDPTCAN